MKRGLFLTLVIVAIALLCSNVYAYAPIITNIPDVWIGDQEDNTGPDINFFRFSNAFNFDDYVDKHPEDPDQSTTNVRWSFLADNSDLITINGINTIADASESIQPDLVAKELTSYPNNDAEPRASSEADFWDLVDSPVGMGPPWTDPTEATALDTIITIYCSNGTKASSTQINVKANVEDGTTDLPDMLTGGMVHVLTYSSPATEGWDKMGYTDGQDAGVFTIATRPTDGGSIGAEGSTELDTTWYYGPWRSPGTDISYVANQVYRVKYNIRSTQTDVTKVPNSRLLTEYIGSSLLAVSAGNRVGKGLFAPDADGEWYSVYTQPPDLTTAGVTNLRLTFELIDFDGNEWGTNYLDEIQIHRFAIPSVASGTPVVAYTSQAEFGSAGWAVGTGLGTATVGSNTTGLFIDTPATVTGTAGLDYGIWEKGATSDVVFEAGHLYRCVYTLQSTDTSTLGKIRLINGNAGGDWNSQVALVTDQTQAHMPDADGEEYSVWIESMPDLYTGGDEYKNQMSFIFDIADGQDAQEGAAYLTNVELVYYSIP